MNVAGWSRGLEVTGGGRGVIACREALLRHLADKTGLTGGCRGQAARGMARGRAGRPGGWYQVLSDDGAHITAHLVTALLSVTVMTLTADRQRAVAGGVISEHPPMV